MRYSRGNKAIRKHKKIKSKAGNAAKQILLMFFIVSLSQRMKKQESLTYIVITVSSSAQNSIHTSQHVAKSG